ncbi:MAG: hypothetical protein JW860_04715 [Sedimentisphaerales bacterium]|nr:hypothetical protein [Sedimentisphaerales bacterium]
MKRLALIITLGMLGLLFSGCAPKCCEGPVLFLPDDANIHYTGRIGFADPLKPRLGGAGSYLEVKFRGSTCDILLEDEHLYGTNHNYIATVIDGNYLGRTKVSIDQKQYGLAENLADTEHTLLVCKATEAQNGTIDFAGLWCDELAPFKKTQTRKIEFIGDSITCGTGLDATGLPYGSGEWYDQHNAYLAYGPLVARALNADWLLSSVSGIGIARNWNSDGPVMAKVYDKLYLNTTSSRPWEAEIFVPDLISICLGTNDFSDGDGTYERQPLNEAEFIKNYIQFIRHMRGRYPNVPICLLTSPMLSGEKDARLKEYLTEIIEHLRRVDKEDKIHMFAFSRVYNHGGSGHPNEEEHAQMAQELLPFYKGVMGLE